MNKTTISVIIPAWNMQEYIRPCLESVLAGAEDDLEIIVVDDGSTDDTFSICQAFAARYSCIRLIRQENRGVSAARNAGIRHASGKYLLFLDADDMLSGSILSRAPEEMALGQHQLVCWNVSCLQGNHLIKQPPFQLGEDARKEWFEHTIHSPCKRGKYFRACWGKLFDSRIIRENQILFDEKLYLGEDAVFLLKYLKHTRKVRFLPDYGYIYRLRPDSAVRRYKPDLLAQSLRQKEYMDGFASAHPAAVTGLYWDLFDKLLVNGGHSDTRKWYEAAKSQLYAKDLPSTRLSRLCRIQRGLGEHIPFYALCKLAEAILRRRRKGESQYE